MAETTENTNDLERAFQKLSAKLTYYNTLFKYMDGDQPTVYSSSRLKEAFSNIDAKFNQNWCSVVVNAALDRMEITGFDIIDTASDARMKELWDNNQLGIESEEVHEAALVTHESFLIVWPDTTTKEIECYYNDPRLCHMFYDSENPRKKVMAAKWYVDEKYYYHMVLYYPDRLEYYKTVKAFKDQPPKDSKPFARDVSVDGGQASNPYGVIPVFHFRINRRSNIGELSNILPLQDAINKLLADMMVAAEYGAFKQRWIISNSDTSDLKNSPNEIWEIPAGDGSSQETQVGEFAGTRLDNYLEAMDKLANSISIISRTPKHYFYNTGSALSGEALIAMEAPLNKKVSKFTESLGAVWTEVAQFMLRLSDIAVTQDKITPIWLPVTSTQPLTEAQTMNLTVATGVPLFTYLKQHGWSDTQLKDLEQGMVEEQKRKNKLGQMVLNTLRNQDSQSNEAIVSNGALDGSAVTR